MYELTNWSRLPCALEIKELNKNAMIKKIDD
jgi:hypothetical protein